MAKVKYMFSRAKEGRPYSILGRFTYNYQTISFSTKEAIRPEHWDFDRERVATKFLTHRPDYIDINAKLDKIDSYVTSTYHTARRNHDLLQLTPERFKGLIKDLIDGREYSDRMPIVDFYRHHLEQLAKRPYKPLSAKSLADYAADLSEFERFSASLPHHPTLPEGSLKLFELYRDFLFSKSQDLAVSTVYKLLKRLKAVFRAAAKEGMITGAKVSSIDIAKDLGLSQQPATKIALYLPEVQHLANFDLTKYPALSATRDLFCFACLTGGLRHENWQDITRANIHATANGKELRAYTRKGDPKPITAPFHELSYRIAERLNYDFPTPVSNQVTNRHLRKLCQLVGFTEEVAIETRKGAGLVVTKHPKHELITCHTARRSYATILFDSGVPIARIVELMTHTDAATTQRYIKEDQARKSARLAALPFFTQK